MLINTSGVKVEDIVERFLFKLLIIQQSVYNNKWWWQYVFKGSMDIRGALHGGMD